MTVKSAQVRYSDRSAAGRDVAHRLVRYANRSDVVVLALPRGGVPVAYEIAGRLHAPLDVYTVRKLGVPGYEELAMGAVASDGTYVVDERLVKMLGITPETFDVVMARELAELRRRELAYRGQRPERDLSGKVAIVVDDGLATGATMSAAIRALRKRNVAEAIVAVPVCPAAACAELRMVADAVVCPHEPEPFRAVGLYYDDFSQVGDDEVRRLLDRAAKEYQGWKAA